ncbi:MAG: protein O-GlcNAcase [Oscillospiraceae bacterium]|nr:protein O-GlcNAcase [Oscillospiraceae bacterium]
MSFQRRGYLEGFYGTPWSDAQRRNMIALMAAHGMNTYAYGAKDDPYHRDKWEQLYPGTELATLQSLVNYCREHGMDFMYCLAPGLTYDYQDETCWAAIHAKFAQIIALGVQSFGLFFDDIPPGRERVEDHLALAKRVCDAFPDKSFTICPMVYHGRGNEPYICELGHGLPENADLFWTGRNICSQWQDVDEAKFFKQNTNKQPLYWDNYPVNDAEMFHEMHLGPIANRDAKLHEHSRGILFNGMEYFECTKLAFLTCADYLRDPENYDPEQSWLRALEILFGKEDAARFVYFAEQCNTSCLKRQNGPRMVEAVESAAVLWRAGDLPAAIALLQDFHAKLEDTRAFLAESQHPMVAELGKWIYKYNKYVDLFGLTIEVLQDKVGRDELKKVLHEYNEIAAVLTEFAMRAFVEQVIAIGEHI